MTDHQFSAIFTAALNDSDREAFVSDWALSSIWGDPEGASAPSQRLDELGELWDAAHLTIRGIRAHTGLSQAAFAERYIIPKRSVENWEGGQRECPTYLRLMLAQLSGAYVRRASE